MGTAETSWRWESEHRRAALARSPCRGIKKGVTQLLWDHRPAAVAADALGSVEAQVSVPPFVPSWATSGPFPCFRRAIRMGSNSRSRAKHRSDPGCQPSCPLPAFWPRASFPRCQSALKSLAPKQGNLIS